MKVLTGCLLLGLAVGVVHGLKCYTCDGGSSFVEKGDCGDTYAPDESHLRMCNATAGEIYCEKYKYGVKKVLTSVTRGCVSECEEHNILGAHRRLCCQTDKCNAAPGALIASMLLTLGAVVLARIF